MHAATADGRQCYCYRIDCSRKLQASITFPEDPRVWRFWPASMMPSKCKQDIYKSSSVYRFTGRWQSDFASVSIDEVTLRRARLVLGWVTVFGRANHVGM